MTARNSKAGGLKGEDMPDICTPDQLASYFQITKPTAIQWLREGKIPDAFKIGGRWRIPKAAIQKLAHDMYGSKENTDDSNDSENQ